MKISVIIPAYNAEKYLFETIKSVQAQTATDWELIIVDDGSTDQTLAISQTFARNDSRIQVAPQSNSGVAAARNYGLTKVSPESSYVAFLDHDDIWEPDALEVMMAALEAKPDLVGAHGLAHFIDKHGLPCQPGVAEALTLERFGVAEDTRLVPWPIDQPTTFSVLSYTNCIWTPGQALIRKEVLNNVGPLDAATVPADDYDLWLRMAQYGDFAFVNHVVIGFRQHDTNGSLDRGRLGRAGGYVMRKNMCSQELSPEKRRIAIAGFRHHQRHISGLFIDWARENAQKKQFVSAAKQVYHSLQSYGLSLGLHSTKSINLHPARHPSRM